MDKNKAKEMWPIIKAFSEGENIEYFNGYSWSKIEYGATFESDFNNYRIMPKPKLVPFTFEDKELLIDKWVIEKGYTAIDKIIRIANDGVLVANKPVTFSRLFHSFEFKDGSPCGKYVNE